MGSGIGYVTAAAGYQTSLYDPYLEMLEKARGYHRQLVDRALEKGRLTLEAADGYWGRVAYTDDLAAALHDAGLVIEAAPEKMDLKKEILRQVEELASPAAILGSNTSSLPITELANAVADPGRVIGVHFFNPAPVMKLVEIVAGLNTRPETVEAVVEFVGSVGKESVVVKDLPGFVTTRIGLMLISEAILAYQEGIAGKESLDKAMKLGYNLPMGPLALADLIGLDVVLHVLDALFENYKDPRYRAPILLRKMVQAGRLGRKTGEGFYTYD
ncbi:MAG: 3-hydroxyacyl-CoA dehydrogenase family protein [Anaerolineae bacterium]|nr:MAG: 3-hydroxyacyl-CoA dehydrogenase family protein [Anaerolineae bacterium]